MHATTTDEKMARSNPQKPVVWLGMSAVAALQILATEQPAKTTLRNTPVWKLSRLKKILSALYEIVVNNGTWIAAR
jgi:hypothetical protein